MTALCLTGCVTNSPGLPNIFLIAVNTSSMGELRVGYFGKAHLIGKAASAPVTECQPRICVQMLRMPRFMRASKRQPKLRRHPLCGISSLRQFRPLYWPRAGRACPTASNHSSINCPPAAEEYILLPGGLRRCGFHPQPPIISHQGLHPGE
jgi:hypothetical protein